MAAKLWPAAAAASGGKCCSSRRHWRPPRARPRGGGGARATLRPSARWAGAQALASRPPERGVADDEKRLGPAKPPRRSGRPRPRPWGRKGGGWVGSLREGGHVAAEGARVRGGGVEATRRPCARGGGAPGEGHVPRWARGGWRKGVPRGLSLSFGKFGFWESFWELRSGPKVIKGK